MRGGIGNSHSPSLASIDLIEFSPSGNRPPFQVDHAALTLAS